jgi:L-lactate utilization protein LutC
MSYDVLAGDEQIAKTKEALETNGFTVVIAEDGAAAKQAALELLPKGAEVLTNTSKTLEKLELDKAINETGDYVSVRNKLNAMWGDESKKREQRKLGAAPDYTIGSVHAITETGEVFIASNTGSQLPSYSYGAGNVIWVVGAQKLVKDSDEAHKRLEEHVLPLESERAKAAYGMPRSNISKLLIVSKETQPGRVTVIIVKEALGF